MCSRARSESGIRRGRMIEPGMESGKQSIGREIRGRAAAIAVMVAAVTVGGGWLPFVNSVLTTAEADGTWADLYERWIGPAPEPPDLSAEEAAALWPSQSPQ